MSEKRSMPPMVARLRKIEGMVKELGVLYKQEAEKKLATIAKIEEVRRGRMEKG